MRVQIKHSVVQDCTVVKFESLKDFYKCIEFLDTAMLQWEPLSYSARLDTASIRVQEPVLNKITKKYGITNEQTKNSTDVWAAGLR